MTKFKDLTGEKFGRLTVIKRVENNNRGQTQWLCRCNCKDKNEVVVLGHNLTHGKTKSCGCLSKELTSERSKKYNTYDLSGEYGIGYTSKGEPFYFDLEDYDKIKDYCWYIDSVTGYVRARINKHKQISMHRLLFIDAEDVDHIHGKNTKNDNRKSNLRPCTRSQNNMNKKTTKNNTSGVTGVYYDKKRNKWISQITINYKNIYLGGFDLFDDAVQARKEAEEKYFGEYSYDSSIKRIV